MATQSNTFRVTINLRSNATASLRELSVTEWNPAPENVTAGPDLAIEEDELKQSPHLIQVHVQQLSSGEVIDFNVTKVPGTFVDGTNYRVSRNDSGSFRGTPLPADVHSSLNNVQGEIGTWAKSRCAS